MTDTRKAWILGFATGFCVGATIILAFFPDRAGSAPHERSCDQKPATFHVHRAEALLEAAYDLDRWPDPTPARRSEVRAFQDHKRCVRDAALRRELAETRDRRASAFHNYRAYRLVTPYDGPNGTHWAIPWYVVSCESYGGSWTASNGSHVGPYQLAWNWNPPWPVTSFADQLAHHRIARMIWTRYGSSHWECA